MAVVALFAGHNMRRRLTGCENAVVTRVTAAAYCSVINESNGVPGRGDVAIVALTGRKYMVSRLDRGSDDAAG